MIDPGPKDIAQVDVRGTPPVVRVVGEIDVSTADLLRRALKEAADGAEVIEVDLGGVTFFDSSGFAALAEQLRAGRQIRVVRTSDAIRRLFTLAGLEELVAD